jgi:hypothetical protein
MKLTNQKWGETQGIVQRLKNVDVRSGYLLVDAKQDTKVGHKEAQSKQSRKRNVSHT